MHHARSTAPRCCLLLQPDIPSATEWELAAACLNHRDRNGKPDCVGFTRNQWGGGTLWRAMNDPFYGWGKWMTKPTTPCGGMYVKGTWWRLSMRLTISVAGRDKLPKRANQLTCTLLPAECPKIDGYEFYSLVDSNFGDVPGGRRTGKTLQQLADECKSLPSCQSFNTNGYLKRAVTTMDQFQRLTGDPCRGLYVKSGTPGKLKGAE